LARATVTFANPTKLKIEKNEKGGKTKGDKNWITRVSSLYKKEEGVMSGA